MAMVTVTMGQPMYVLLRLEFSTILDKGELIFKMGLVVKLLSDIECLPSMIFIVKLDSSQLFLT